MKYELLRDRKPTGKLTLKMRKWVNKNELWIVVGAAVVGGFSLLTMIGILAAMGRNYNF